MDIVDRLRQGTEDAAAERLMMAASYEIKDLRDIKIELECRIKEMRKEHHEELQRLKIVNKYLLDTLTKTKAYIFSTYGNRVSFYTNVEEVGYNPFINEDK